MIQIRPDHTRGEGHFGWLQARHSFSFSSWQDPRYMGVSALRVINQDIVSGHSGFGQHPHDNMEILTYVLRGTLSHRDTLGSVADIQAGEFQLMSAGTGIQHSEMNRYEAPVELLQIWLHPNVKNAAPRYAQKAFPRTPGLQAVAAPEGSSSDALPIRQDATIYRGLLATGAQIEHPLNAARSAWVQVISGSLMLNGLALEAGDGAELSHERLLQFTALADSEFLLFDLP